MTNVYGLENKLQINYFLHSCGCILVYFVKLFSFYVKIMPNNIESLLDKLNDFDNNFGLSVVEALVPSNPYVRISWSAGVCSATNAKNPVDAALTLSGVVEYHRFQNIWIGLLLKRFGSIECKDCIM